MKKPIADPTPAPVRLPRRRRPALASSADRELAMYAKALGHPARIAIVRFLMECGECMCGNIVNHLPLAQATVSQHLKVLKQAKIVRGEIDPPRVCYCVDPSTMKRLQQLIATLEVGAPEPDPGPGGES